MRTKDTIKLSVRVDRETYNRLCKMCKENESISKLVREYIDIGLGIKSTTEDIDRISEIIKHQIETVCEQPLERLVKNIKSSEASKYVVYSLLKEFSRENTDEIIEKAERQAIMYATNKVG